MGNLQNARNILNAPQSRRLFPRIIYFPAPVAVLYIHYVMFNTVLFSVKQPNHDHP